jgi:hypothetical protein
VIYPKYAKKVDLNQQEIVDALKKIGCAVVVIGTPVDLLVGLGARNYLIEIKRPGEKPRTKNQKRFLTHWPGQVRICETAEEAITLVTRAYESA